MNRNILLLAGNYDQARAYAKENNLSIGQWVYVIDADRIRGITNPDVRRIGTYYERKDIREIESVIAQYSNRDIAEATKDNEKSMIIVTSFFDVCPKYTCEKCGKPYGKTNLKYEGIEIWAACDCTPKDKAYMFNTNIDYDKLGIPDLMSLTAQKVKDE